MNLYDVLGVSKSATGADIRKAYRQLSKKYHPDVCKGADTEQKFKEIADAYNTLRDPRRRKAYDQREATKEVSPRKTYKRRTGKSLQYDAYISLYEACFGTDLSITFTHMIPCEDSEDVIEREETLIVPILPGCLSGETLRIKGKGNAVKGGATPGDLFVVIHVDLDEKFHLNGFDLETIESINIAQALIGGKKEIELLDKDMSGNPIRVRVTIPAGSTAGSCLKIPERGFTRKNGQRGDLYILLNIAVPDMSDNKALIEEFASKIGMPLET